MDITANLKDGSGQEWPVAAMAIHMEVGRFPRMYAQVEGPRAPAAGGMTFTLTEASNDAVAMADLSQSTWHVCASLAAPEQGRCLLVLMPDPECTLQLGPFAANGQGPASLMARALASGDIVWEGESSASIEAFVSLWETPELLARRLARLTNETFRVTPGKASEWHLRWGASLPELMEPGVPDSITGASVVADTYHALEQSVRCVHMPCDFDEALREGAGDRSFFVLRTVQSGTPGATAVTAEMPANLEGAPLPELRARWLMLSEAAELDALWRGAPVSTADGDNNQVLSALFLYDGQSTSSRIGRASAMFAEMLGGWDPVDHFGKGWAAYVLAVPTEAVPSEVTLLDHLLERHRVASIWQALTQCVGCGLHGFDNPVPAWPASLPAVTIDNPLAEDQGTVSLTEDGMGYRTKIWVRILGVQGDLEVDWATPFASHDNSESGGGGGGDLLLVPEANTLGYVSFLGGQGAPYFHLNTHYRDVAASPLVKPKDYKHGLVTDAGLHIEEKSRNTLIKVCAILTLRAQRLLQQLGTSPEGVQAQANSKESTE